MMTQADRDEIRRRARARIAAQREGTELRSVTVPAAAVKSGDWLVEIEASFGLAGPWKAQSYRALKLADGGARVVARIERTDGPGCDLVLDDREGYVVPDNAPCVVRRRVPVAH